MAGEGSELHDMEETMSELGFVGSDDDDNKEIWKMDLEGDAMAFSSGAGGRPGSSGRRDILVALALQVRMHRRTYMHASPFLNFFVLLQ